MGFGLSKPNYDDDFMWDIEPTAEMEEEYCATFKKKNPKRKNPFKYEKKSKKNTYPPFLDDEVSYDYGIWQFNALDIEFDEDTGIISKYDVEIPLTKEYRIKNKSNKELFHKYINTTSLKDTQLIKNMIHYIKTYKDRSSTEEKIYHLVERARVSATKNELIQEVRTLLIDAGLKWTGKRYVLPLKNNICKPVDNSDLLNFIVYLTGINELSQETLDKVLKYFTRENEPVKHCIVTENGYYDFNTQKFHKKSKEEIIIDKKTPYKYRKKLIDTEPPEKLKKFLTDIFHKNKWDSYKDLKDDITVLLELIGYMLDDGNRFQILIILIGDSNSGKGLTMRLVNFLLDGRICDVDIFKGRAIGKELNALVENDLNVIHEFKTNGKIDINFFKQVTGGDNVQISKLYGEPKTYTHNEYAKTVLTTNDVKDLIENADNASLRRLNTYIIFKNVPDETIDDLDEQIRDEPDAMDWLLTNSIEAYANVLKSGNDFKAKHSNEDTLDMISRYNNPILEELQCTYYYNYDEWKDDKEFLRKNGVRPKDIKNKFALNYPKLKSNKSFAKIIRDAFYLKEPEGDEEVGCYITKQYTIDKNVETYIVGLLKI